MPLHASRIALIGAGNMGEALMRGLLRAQAVTPEQVVATGRRQQRLDELAQAYGVEVTRDNVAAVRDANIVLLAVKPQIFGAVLEQIEPAVRADALVISVAAGVTIRSIERHLGASSRIVRAMPNTPALVDTGATALAASNHVQEQDLQRARTIFEAVGQVIHVDEALMDAVTGLSGSGPAFVFAIIEAFSDAGVRVGLPRYQAQALAAQTVLGSAKMLLETGEHPGVLKDRVTSPGGTAIAGLHTLENGGLRTTLINGVVAAAERSRELGATADDDE